MTRRLLYQFPLSLYCEKTRWNLDWKGLPWQAANLLPGPHMLTAWRLAGQRRLPVLRDGGECIGDSTRIALYLDARYPSRPLLPADRAQRHAVLVHEDAFDTLGEHVRRCVWSLAVDSSAVAALFFRHYDPARHRIGQVATPLLRQMIRRTFDVWPAPVAASWQAVLAALADLEARLAGNPAAYLVGDGFTLADLTAAAMLGPLVGPPESPWGDDKVQAGDGGERQRLRATTAGQWVLRLYREHRAPRIAGPPPA